MHEYGMARDILDNVLREAGKHNANAVKEITLDVGPLTMVNPEQLVFCLKTVSKDTITEDMKINLNMLPVEIRCRNNHETEIKEEITNVFEFITKLKCPVCGEKAEIIGGKELILKEIIAE